MASTTLIQPSSSAGFDTYIASTDSTTNYSTSKTLLTEYDSVSGVYAFPMIKFDLSTVNLAASGIQIVSAEFGMTVSTYASTSAANVYVSRMISTWADTSVTYDGPWSTSGTWSTSYSSAVSVSTDGQYAWDVSTFVQDWYEGVYTNRGFIVANGNSTSTSWRKTLLSAESTTSTSRPYLKVITETAPVASLQNPSGSLANPTAVYSVRPWVAANYYHGGALNISAYQIQVYDVLGNLAWDSSKTAFTT